MAADEVGGAAASSAAAIVIVLVAAVAGPVTRGLEPAVWKEGVVAVLLNVPVTPNSRGENQLPAPPRPECAYSCGGPLAAAVLETGRGSEAGVWDSMSWIYVSQTILLVWKGDRVGVGVGVGFGRGQGRGLC